MALVRFLGFAPDLPSLTPGIFVDCAGIIPTRKGFRPRPSAQALYVALPSACLGEGFLAQYLDGTTRLFAGTATQLYEGRNGTWSPVGSGGYGGGKWRFAQYGNDCIATNGVDVPQVVGTAGSFAALGGSPPVAPLVEALYGFTFLFESDNWHCSGIGTDNVWNNSVASQSASGPLIDTPGPITAARKLGRSVVVYKTNGVYRGDFVDIPLIWDWTLIAPVPGAAGQGCVIDIGMQHAFIGTDDFYLTDGSTVVPISGPGNGPNPIKEWFFATVDGTNVANIEGVHDQINETVYWYFPSTAANPAGSLDSVIAWNYRTQKWTKDNYPIEAIIRPFLSPQTSWTYNKFDATYGTYNGIPNLPYDAQLFFGSNVVYLGYIDTNHVAQSFSGPAAAAKIVTGDYGDNRAYWYLNRLRPLFSKFPSIPISSMSITGFHRESLGDSLEQGDTEALDPAGNVNLRASDAFHRWELDFTGDFEIEGIDPDLSPDGEL